MNEEDTGTNTANIENGDSYYEFTNIFNLEKIQKIQDEFSAATGVASIITQVDGTPITKSSNFCCFCNDMVRKTEKGLKNSILSDSIIGSPRNDGPRIHMVVHNPDLNGLKLNNFQKAARQLHKITGEMQDIVMSIRMVPLAATFNKMQRLLRDMSKKLEKDIHVEFSGEETEVDKNIIEHISDPLMHLIRKSIDHGIEPPEDRQAKGKPQTGNITLEAKNAGSEVLIIVKDDGKGTEVPELPPYIRALSICAARLSR